MSSLSTPMSALSTPMSALSTPISASLSVPLTAPLIAPLTAPLLAQLSAPSPPLISSRPPSQSSPSRLLDDSEEMPYTLADLDAIYRDPQDTQGSRETQDSLEQDLTALQETLEKDMLEMQRSSALLAPPPDIEDVSLELQEIMVDDVVGSQMILDDDVFAHDEMLDEDPHAMKEDDFE